jgi:hypothetical protein
MRVNFRDSLARVAENKISNYLLCASHPFGKEKYKFLIGFGFRIEEPSALRDALLRHLQEAETIEEHVTDYGVRYTKRCSLTSPDGRNPCINSVWQVEADGTLKFITITKLGRAP